ncbi:MAG: prepilin-type N-terminal cleavage/methylation domain-containing protein [Omnitrophica bacterium]|nr:prepilin-type N-terminal cleavage/methylation domain-containing protein [Candidatus Omnitrophota bacterium]
MKVKKKSLAGFTLIELMFTAGVMAVVLGGLLQLFIYCMNLGELSGNTTVATAQAQSKLEEIRNHNFADIVTDYSLGGTVGNTFTLTNLDGMGVIYIDDTNAELLEIEIAVSFRTRPNRVIGADKNLNGILDSGEQESGYGKLDSPVRIISLRARR